MMCVFTKYAHHYLSMKKLGGRCRLGNFFLPYQSALDFQINVLVAYESMKKKSQLPMYLFLSSKFEKKFLHTCLFSTPSTIDSDSLSHILKTEFFFLGRLAVQG